MPVALRFARVAFSVQSERRRSRLVDGAIGLSVASDIHNKSEVLGLLRARPGARLLDIGCNVGSFSLECSRLVGADEVYGIEIDAGAAEVARAAGVRVTQADCNEPLPYEDGMFDVIVANQVIEHLYFTDDFIEEVRRILRPEGQLVISTTNLAALHYRLWLLAGMQPSGLHPSEHQFGNHLRGVDNPRRGHKSVFTYYRAECIRCRTAWPGSYAGRLLHWGSIPRSTRAVVAPRGNVRRAAPAAPEDESHSAFLGCPWDRGKDSWLWKSRW
jgi:SAM-dependent methyltransferase